MHGCTPITPRQRGVIQQIARGCSNDETAEALGISERTVRSHVVAIRVKLRVARKAQIPVAYFQQTGDNPLTSEVTA
jgi:DNA-binding CsgD family transcriptional regulator